MSDALHLVQISLDARRLTRWAAECRIDGDLGYACHAVMCDAFGELRLQPFHAEEKMGRVKVLGYGNADAAAMQRAMDEAAEPAVAACFGSIESKPMPSDWETGRRLAFRLRVAPTRQGRNEQGKRREADALLFETDGNADREEVYRRWLESRLDGAVELQGVQMTAFRLMQAVRRGIVGEGKRPARPITLPDVVFEGTLKVADGARFSDILRRGVGRHDAFGFGAMMLRPARAA